MVDPSKVPQENRLSSAVIIMSFYFEIIMSSYFEIFPKNEKNRHFGGAEMPFWRLFCVKQKQKFIFYFFLFH